MRRANSRQLAEQLFNCFRGREDKHATARDGGGFRPTGRALTATDLIQHVEGRTCYGFYVTRPDNTCCVTAVDFDGKHEKDWRARAAKVYDVLAARGFTPLLELSQSGDGAHVWLVLAEPTPAATVRAYWRNVLEAAGVSCREIFPKQDSLEPGGLGNLIRYPLWAKSAFYTACWGCEIAPGSAIAAITPCRLPDLPVSAPAPVSTAVESTPGLSPRVQRLLSCGLLRARWEGDTTGLQDRSRSGLAMSIAALLVRAYVPTPDIEAAIRVWGAEQGVEDKTGRTRWLQATIAKAYELAAGAREVASQSILTLADCTLEYLDASSNRARAYCPSGISSLDECLEGVAYGELALVAARPSHGKSAFAIQWADYQSSRGVPVLYLSEEMGRYALGARCAARILQADKLDPAEIDRNKDRIRAHFGAQAPIYVRQACYTIDRAEEVIEEHVAEGVRAVVVDYTQILRSRGGRQRNEEVADVSIKLRQAATRHNIALLACAQLNREIEQRGGRPRMSDLGDSGQLERDADLILVLRWPWKDDPEHEPREEYRISIVKRRNGPISRPEIEARFSDVSQTIY